MTFPVAVGTGKKLFRPDAEPSAYTLSASRTTGTGVVISSYEFQGSPTYGTYGLPEDA